MEYMCAYKTCPHRADPCIFSEMDLEKGLSRSTVCPIGEEERFIKNQPENPWSLDRGMNGVMS